jgi:dihydroflavonol-4-reductase
MGVQRVLVTGGTGYLARWCIRLLLEGGYAVHATLRDLSGEPELRSLFASGGDTERLRVFAADLRRDDGWQEAADKCDYVLHVASPFPPVQPRDPDELIVPARDGTLRVLRSAYAAARSAWS